MWNISITRSNPYSASHLSLFCSFVVFSSFSCYKVQSSYHVNVMLCDIGLQFPLNKQQKRQSIKYIYVFDGSLSKENERGVKGMEQNERMGAKGAPMTREQKEITLCLGVLSYVGCGLCNKSVGSFVWSFVII